MSDTDVTQPSSLEYPYTLSSILGGGQPPAVTTPLSGGTPPFVPDAGPVVGMSNSPTAAAAGNPPGQPNVADVKTAPLWQRIVMGAMAGAAFGAGEKTFGGGMARGAAGVLQQKQQQVENQQRQQQIDNQTQETQSNIKFRDAQAASMAIDAKMKDAQLQALPEQLREQAEQHSLSVMKQFSDMGLQPVLAVPDTGKDATIGMQQLTDSHGAVPSLFTVHAGGQIIAYNLNQLTEDPKGLDIVNQAGAAQNRPPINMAQWKSMPTAARTDLMNKSMNFFNPTPSKENVGVLFQQYQNNLDTYSKNPNADPAILARLQGTVAMLGKVKNGLQTDEINTETRKAATNMANQQAMADYKDNQKDASTYGYAVDNTGEMHYVTKAMADKYGLAGFEPQTAATLRSDRNDFRVLNDVAQKSNMVHDSLQKVSPTSLGPLAKILNSPEFANPKTGTEAIRKEINQGLLSKDAQDYANNVLQLRESAMGLQKVLTGSARANEVQIEALLKTIPGIESSSDVAQRKLDAFNQNITRLREGMPSAFPGLPSVPLKGTQNQPVIPAGATPGRDANGNIIGYKTSDGKVVRF